MANKIVKFDKSVTNVNTQIKDVEGVITNDEIKESDIKKMYRIGKKGDNPRPMLIEFKEKSMKNMIMENCLRMKQLSDELKNVSISHDFTKEQREKCKKLVAEAKDKQKQESGEFLYRHTSSDCASMVFNSSGNFNKIKVGLLNIRSFGPNVDNVYELLNDGLDVLILTETWHKSSDNICLSLAKPRDFIFLEQVRLNDPGHGGLVTYFRNNYKCVKIPLPVIIIFEAICFKLTLRKTSVIFLVIYRPGSAPPAKLFFEELILVLEQITLLCCSIVVAGDFNIHVETLSDIYATALADIFSSFDLVNRINQSTHVLGCHIGWFA
ncbi:hypothetical protein HELRODRAFT_164153 [Helobdella robusta]|uniref:Endonuclease/exonuclease/phosphatase domain-containing protein n=1 Tax=Helobdella robusta TaxID=6412 RepID=T1EV04_HELRO|nr:hypothetical protein HELRODRAFT_164153 [Helobdella robusta]ESN94329.1 hypothetical protein HELRODRAFT_164153 [Helobdella robusta]